MVYESLVRNKPGIGQTSTWTEVLPNLAESWEESPDHLTMTFKLRQGVKWQNVAPVGARAFDSSDVVASFARYATLPNNNRASSVNSVNPSAPVLSVTAADAQTVVWKLKEPASYLMQRLASMITGEIGGIYPKETDHGFDPRKGQIGTGGFMLDRYTPSAGLSYKRNPAYWGKDGPYIDTLDVPIISSYPTQLAQFQTGAIYSIPGAGAGPGVQPQDVLTVKHDEPSMQMVKLVPASNSPGFITGFGWNDLDGKKAPWLDMRVRQAMSMALDRDAYITAFYNVDKFEAAGLPVDTYYNTSMGPIPGVALDPRDKAFGENAKYLSLNVIEAKKLLAAAGFGEGFEYNANFVGSGNFGPTYPKQVETMNSFMREIGLKPNAVPIDYNLKYLPDFVTQRGKHEGVVFRIGAVTSPDAVDYYVWRFYSKAGATSGAVFTGPDGGEMSGDVQVDTMIDKAKAETDAKKRVAILGDLQRYLAKMCYCVPNPGTATNFDVAWPVVKNFYTFQNDSRAINQGYYTWWLDQAQPPIKKS